MTMSLPDALLNAKKYIREPKYSGQDKMWAYEIYKNGRWGKYYFMTEELAWKSFYAQFRAIKESLLKPKEQSR